VKYLLDQNNIPYKPIVIDLPKGEQKGEAYLKINPFGQVPAIVEGDFKLIQSTTILRYLSNSKPVAEHYYPKDAKARAKVDLFYDWFAANCDKVNKQTRGYWGLIPLAENA